MTDKNPKSNPDGIEGLETAPTLFFDEVPLCGATNAICRMTLTVRYDTYANGDKPVRRRRTVAHVQFPFEAVGQLRQMLDAIEDLGNRGKRPVN